MKEKEKKNSLTAMLQQHKQRQIIRRQQKQRQHDQLRSHTPVATISSVAYKRVDSGQTDNTQTRADETNKNNLRSPVKPKKQIHTSPKEQQEEEEPQTSPVHHVKVTVHTGEKDRDDRNHYTSSQITTQSARGKALDDNIAVREQIAALESLLDRRERNIKELREHYEKVLQENDWNWELKYNLALDDAHARQERAQLFQRRGKQKWEGPHPAKTRRHPHIVTCNNTACHSFTGGRIFICTLSCTEKYGSDDESFDDSFSDTYDGSGDDTCNRSQDNDNPYLQEQGIFKKMWERLVAANTKKSRIM